MCLRGEKAALVPRSVIDFRPLGAVGPGNGRVYMRILVILMLSGTLGIVGCDSESGGAAGSGGAGGGGGMGGAGGATDPAAQFCDDYNAICGFDSGGHSSQMECEAAYNGYDSDRQACVEMHVGFAEGDPTTHCPHATGEAPCN